MQRKLMKPQWMLSILSVAMLTACGGGDTLIGEDHHVGFLTPPADKTDDTTTSKGTEPKVVDQSNPTVNKFLTDIAEKGQQNSPTVVAVDNNTNGKIDNADRIAYDQPGIVSEICAKSKCAGYTDPNASTTNNSSNSGSNSSNSGSSSTSSTTDNDYILMRDINNRFHLTYTSGTIDGNANIPRDAGINKITKKRVNGQLQDYGGSIGREFNEVILFANESAVNNKQQYLTSYFRNPAVAGWSYQTFGNFFGDSNSGYLKNRRDVLVGYQSIGNPTLTSQMPTAGSADYTGISHAYYNSAQVTMHNKIHADFGARNLNYETTSPAILHTFETLNGHVIEERPDLNLSGSASWAAGSGDFSGNVNAANGLSGELKGRFYGPNAEEIGGVYGMQGKDSNGNAIQYVGGFGGKR
ncbi:MAG: transferrin-binding protein-like solute binding protein [Cardiobacteriaceae bacterium]|nr:transferrin-binding protein-like solute binding protein [Cardiobacteriaceae bacterium]